MYIIAINLYRTANTIQLSILNIFLPKNVGAAADTTEPFPDFEGMS